MRPPAEAPPAPLPLAVVNAASYLPEFPSRSIASIYGTELSSTTSSWTALPGPTVLAGTVVRVDGEPVPLYYVSLRQINFVVPKNAAGRDLVVVREGVASAPLSLSPVLVAPAIFTLDGMPRGPAAARHAGTPGMPVVTSLAPAVPGEWVALFLTGLGVRNAMIMAPEILLLVRVGELQAEVGYSGAAPGFPGLSRPSGQLPLTVTVGSVQSNTAALAVTDIGTVLAAAP